jgi:hypothetical protein
VIGYANILGPDNWPGPSLPPAPVVLLNLPSGLQRPGLRVYLQGIVQNDASVRGYSVTNGLRLHVNP